jgi:hypothetical protein
MLILSHQSHLSLMSLPHRLVALIPCAMSVIRPARPHPHTHDSIPPPCLCPPPTRANRPICAPQSWPVCIPHRRGPAARAPGPYPRS